MINLSALIKLYLKNIFLVMPVALILQSIPIVAGPMLTKIYSPEQFGFFA